MSVPRTPRACSAPRSAANARVDEKQTPKHPTTTAHTAQHAGVVTRGALLRSGAALFALGFVDAGYSGDWSRIGAISKDTEEALKLAAYAVVPLCLAVVFSPSSEDGSNNT